MKRILPAVLLLFVSIPALGVDDARSKGASSELVIRAQGSEKDWDASKQDVEKVLHSAASELWKHFPGRKLHSMLVQPRGGPIVLFKRGPNGEYHVRLDTGGSYWAQYSYQFAHEFTHILCGYREGDQGNLWFEESLCELGSLFALRRMGETWKTKPPYSNWKGYAEKLAEYADERMKKAALPEKMTLAQWYAANAKDLQANPTDRDRNNIVALALLPLVEKSPSSWEAITYLNAKKTDKPRAFAEHLKDWRDAAPDKHKAFVEQVANEFGVKLAESP